MSTLLYYLWLKDGKENFVEILMTASPPPYLHTYGMYPQSPPLP